MAIRCDKFTNPPSPLPPNHSIPLPRHAPPGGARAREPPPARPAAPGPRAAGGPPGGAPAGGSARE
ncbi:hypothetical protein KXV66_008460, partial [Aspergillus fumigatus]